MTIYDPEQIKRERAEMSTRVGARSGEELMRVLYGDSEPFKFTRSEFKQQINTCCNMMLAYGSAELQHSEGMMACARDYVDMALKLKPDTDWTHWRKYNEALPGYTDKHFYVINAVERELKSRGLLK